MTDKTGKRTAPSLDPTIQMHLGRRLRSMFDQVANEPVPDRFRDLLDQLEKSGGDPPAERRGQPAERFPRTEPTETAGPSK